MTHLTTHVLDAATGSPAAGIAIGLATASGTPVAVGVTDADGRLSLGPDLLDAGDYTLRFATGAYFAGAGVDSFHPFVTVAFTVEVAADGSSRHYHVPLLVSPFAYTTYRGS